MSEIFDRMQAALVDRYHVERELGRGGMATVFLARDLKHDRAVAIKVLFPDLAATIGPVRFHREIKLAAKLQHPHILSLYDSGEADGLFYYVMPFVEGESLRDRLDREKQLPIDDALQIAYEVADGLGYAHSLGIVHRDIKPDNILLSGGHALIADFGIARAATSAGEKLTETGMAVGTPAYMSPEQAAGMESGPPSDLYSLGCVLYEMLAGTPPFTGPNARAIMARHAMDPVPGLQVVRDTVPDEVEDAVMVALAKVPADRFQTASQFLEALGAPSGVTASRWTPSRITANRRAASRAITAMQNPKAAWRWMGVAFLLLAVVVVGGIAAVRMLWSRSRPAGTVEAGGLDPHHVAVLYFGDLSQKKDLGFLADGLTEALIAELGQVQGLSVVSRNGVATFRNSAVPRDSIARVLGAGTLVQGDVEERAGRVRVSVRLVDGSSGADFQRASVELPAGNLLVLRDSLTREVARLIRARVGEEIRLREERAGTQNPDAWALVQRASKAWKDADSLVEADDLAGATRDFELADSLLARAATLDASWAEPIVQRGAIAYRQSHLASRPQEAAPLIARGLSLAEEALRLDPKNAGALELRGSLRYSEYLLHLEPDPGKATKLLNGAQEDLRAATDIDPTRASAFSTLSHLHYQTDDIASAVLAARQAYQADAYLSVANDILWRLFLGSYDLEQPTQAKRWCEEGHQRFPQDYRFAECQLWVMTTDAGTPNVAQAWHLLAQVESLAPEPVRAFQKHRSEMVVGGVIARAGLTDSARHVLTAARADSRIDPEQELLSIEAFMRTLAGDNDEAIALLKRYVAANPEHSFSRGGDTHWWWRVLRSDPRFKELMGK